MSTTNDRPTPAGWHHDPAGSGSLRWWDGTSWTEHLQPAAPAQPAGYPSQPTTYPAHPAQPGTYTYPGYAPQPLPKVAPGTPAYGPFIWIVTLLPLIGLLTLPLSFADLEQQLSAPYTTEPGDPFGGASAASLLAQAVATLVGWLVYAAGIVLAYFDRKWLLARGYAQPFHWAFAFLNPVYPIGRSIVVRRRSGRGIAPMWVSFALVAVSILISIGLVWYIVDLTVRGVSTMPGLPA